MKTMRQMMMIVALGTCLLTGMARGTENYSTLEGIGRGFANLFAGWIELPRCMTFYAVEWPAIGILPGTIQGAGMTVVRAFGGIVDLFTLGYLSPGNTVYDSMDEPLFPWQGPWLPTKESDTP